MKILKCLIFATMSSVIAMEISEIDLYSDVKREQNGPITSYSIILTDNDGAKEISVLHNEQTDKYTKTEKTFSPQGVKVKALYEGPKKLKAQFDRLRTRYNTDHGIINESPNIALQSLLDRLTLAEQEFSEAQTALETGPSSRSNINN